MLFRKFWFWFLCLIAEMLWHIYKRVEKISDAIYHYAEPFQVVLCHQCGKEYNGVMVCLEKGLTCYACMSPEDKEKYKDIEARSHE